MLNHADAIIHADWRIITWQLALQVSISTGSVCSIIEPLGHSKVCSKWVIQSLTRFRGKLFLLNYWNVLMLRIVTGDKT
jgi:hypothetical protein